MLFFCFASCMAERVTKHMGAVGRRVTGISFFGFTYGPHNPDNDLWAKPGHGGAAAWLHGTRWPEDLQGSLALQLFLQGA